MRPALSVNTVSGPSMKFDAGLSADVLNENPVAVRLKELEILERIAEKIDRIQVNGGLDNILTDLINIKK